MTTFSSQWESADRSAQQSSSHHAYFPNASRQIKKYEQYCGLMPICICPGYVS